MAFMKFCSKLRCAVECYDNVEARIFHSDGTIETLQPPTVSYPPPHRDAASSEEYADPDIRSVVHSRANQDVKYRPKTKGVMQNETSLSKGGNSL